MILVDKLTKIFSVGAALDQVSFEVPQGEVCGLIGPNGAGKTTLLRILATVLRRTSGEVRVAGLRPGDDLLELRRRVGYMPDSFGTYEEMRVDSFLEFFAHLYELPRQRISQTLDDILTLVDLRPLRHAPIASLSLGVRQRLSLARVLLHNPQVLLLDEPVSGLDPRARVEMRALLRELGSMGKTVLISSHVLTDLADLSDRLVVLEQGRVIFSGTFPELKQEVAGPRTVEILFAERRDEALEFLRGQRWTQEVRATPNGDGIELILSAPDLPLAEISGSLFEAGFPLTGFREQEVDLEEAFLRLTQGIVS